MDRDAQFNERAHAARIRFSATARANAGRLCDLVAALKQKTLRGLFLRKVFRFDDRAWRSMTLTDKGWKRFILVFP